MIKQIYKIIKWFPKNDRKSYFPCTRFGRHPTLPAPSENNFLHSSGGLSKNNDKLCPRVPFWISLRLIFGVKRVSTPGAWAQGTQSKLRILCPRLPPNPRLGRASVCKLRLHGIFYRLTAHVSLKEIAQAVLKLLCRQRIHYY
jgi:hypothetical protein